MHHTHPRAIFRRSVNCLLLLLVAGFALPGCGIKYKMWETLGYEKRDLLVGEIEDARDAQNEAKEEFQSALDRLLELSGSQDSELAKVYKKLNSDYEDAEGAAKSVREEIDEVRGVARDLFKEWEQEIEQYQDPSLKQKSQAKLTETQSRYSQLIQKMDSAAASMDPVLATLKDQVLFLKHNLNAQAIANLDSTANKVQADVEALIKEMNASIQEAESFIGQMQK